MFFFELSKAKIAVPTVKIMKPEVVYWHWTIHLSAKKMRCNIDLEGCHISKFQLHTNALLFDRARNLCLKRKEMEFSLFFRTPQQKSLQLMSLAEQNVVTVSHSKRGKRDNWNFRSINSRRETEKSSNNLSL